MSKEKFTPGPWKMKIYGKTQDSVTIHGDDDAPLASLYFFGKKETYANGRLIAAAPEMFAKLAELENALRPAIPLLADDIAKVLEKVRGEE